jgi:hypothetical protein
MVHDCFEPASLPLDALVRGSLVLFLLLLLLYLLIGPHLGDFLPACRLTYIVGVFFVTCLTHLY